MRHHHPSLYVPSHSLSYTAITQYRSDEALFYDAFVYLPNKATVSQHHTTLSFQILSVPSHGFLQTQSFTVLVTQCKLLVLIWRVSSLAPEMLFSLSVCFWLWVTHKTCPTVVSSFLLIFYPLRCARRNRGATACIKQTAWEGQLSFSLSQPNWSEQMVALLQLRSAPRFSPLPQGAWSYWNTGSLQFNKIKRLIIKWNHSKRVWSGPTLHVKCNI